MKKITLLKATLGLALLTTIGQVQAHPIRNTGTLHNMLSPEVRLVSQ